MIGKLVFKIAQRAAEMNRMAPVAKAAPRQGEGEIAKRMLAKRLEMDTKAAREAAQAARNVKLSPRDQRQAATDAARARYEKSKLK